MAPHNVLMHIHRRAVSPHPPPTASFPFPSIDTQGCQELGKSRGTDKFPEAVQAALDSAHAATKLPGSATACIAELQGSELVYPRLSCSVTLSYPARLPDRELSSHTCAERGGSVWSVWCGTCLVLSGCRDRSKLSPIVMELDAHVSCHGGPNGLPHASHEGACQTFHRVPHVKSSPISRAAHQRNAWPQHVHAPFVYHHNIASRQVSLPERPHCRRMTCTSMHYPQPAPAHLQVTANVGDSGFIVIRNGEVTYQSTPMQHFFDCPLQFGAYPEYVEATDNAEDAEIQRLQVRCAKCSVTWYRVSHKWTLCAAELGMTSRRAVHIVQWK